MITELEYLIQKFLDGETSGKEERTLKRLLEDTTADEYSEVKAYFGFTTNEKQKDEIPFDFREFTFGVVDNGVSLNKNRSLKRVLWIAAVGVILITGTFFIKLFSPERPAKQKYSEQELREGLLNTQKALTIFTENLNESISGIESIGSLNESNN
jgi:hypothetical protein